MKMWKNKLDDFYKWVKGTELVELDDIDVEGHILRTMETPAQQEKCVLNMLFDYKVVTPKELTN